jgi:hypothetical protein
VRSDVNEPKVFVFGPQEDGVGRSVIDSGGLREVLSRSHKGAAGMRSVLTFEKVVWIVDARVER